MQPLNPTTALDEILDQAAAELIPEPPAEDATEEERERAARFRIETAEQLAWATRKYARASEELDQVRQAAEAQISRIKAWQTAEERRLKGRMAYFEGLAAEHLRDRQREDKKLKGIPTPYGRVQARKQQPEWKVTNEDALVRQLKDLAPPDQFDQVVRTTQEPAMAGLKELVKAGEVLRMAKAGEDFTTCLPIYRLEARWVNGDGEIEWIPMDGLLIAERPNKIAVEVDK